MIRVKGLVVVLVFLAFVGFLAYKANNDSSDVQAAPAADVQELGTESPTLELRESLKLGRHSGVDNWLDKVCDTETDRWVYVTHRGGVFVSDRNCK